MKERVHAVYCEDTKGIIVENHGYPVAGVILDSWCPNSVVGHVAIDEPMALRVLVKELFTYVFITAGRGILIGTTPSTNKKAIKFNEHLGFKPVSTIKDGYAVGVDFIIYQMNKADCRFIPKEIRLQEVA